jgi:hypothetical protein
MSRFTVELVPNTLVRKSTISNDETGSGSVFGFAIINGLDIDCSVGKSLGIDAGDHINSWCGVHLEIYDSAKALDRHDLADTRAKLFHHVDGHGVAMDDYPGGGLSLFSKSECHRVGMLAGFVSLSILDIKARIHRNEFRKSSSNLTSLIRDLEHTKSICRRPDARTVCPRYIRERLEEMESRGVGWYEGTLDIVRHAEARNENLWV